LRIGVFYGQAEAFAVGADNGIVVEMILPSFVTL
jgi:hypothetical protein